MIGRIVSLESTAYTEWMLYFFIYSVLGWLLHIAYDLLRGKHLRSSGFLRGPWLPSYGFGALLGLLLSQWLPLPYFWRPVTLFVLYIIIFSGLDATFHFFLTQLLPESPLQKRSLRSYVFHGLLFSLAALVMLYVLHPLVQHAIYKLSDENIRYLSWLAQWLLLIDFVLSIRNLDHLHQKRKTFSSDKETKSTEGLIDWLSTLNSYERYYLARYPQEREKEWPALFPQARQKRHLRRANSIGHKIGQFFAWLLEAPTEDSTIANGNPHSFAHGFKPYKLFWVFVAGGTIGFILETLFCIVKNGHLESRQGMLYGPFSQIYGFGAILMLLPLYPMRKKNNLFIFFASSIIGGGFEAVASMIQEYALGSVSWQYEKYAVALFGGRTSLVYMLMWGALGILLIRVIYPKLSRWIERIPNRQGMVFTWVLLALLLIDGTLSALAVHRWNARLENPAPTTGISHLLDEAYPNEFMENIYPNMVHK